MVMQLRGYKCYLGRGKWVKIPILSENVDKRSVKDTAKPVLKPRGLYSNRSGSK